MGNDVCSPDESGQKDVMALQDTRSTGYVARLTLGYSRSSAVQWPMCSCSGGVAAVVTVAFHCALAMPEVAFFYASVLGGIGPARKHHGLLAAKASWGGSMLHASSSCSF